MGKDMRGQRPSRDDDEILGEEHYCKRRTVFFVGYFSSFGVWVDCYRGAPGFWEFWAWGLGILTES
jgi:hypothetical protein